MVTMSFLLRSRSPPSCGLKFLDEVRDPPARRCVRLQITRGDEFRDALVVNDETVRIGDRDAPTVEPPSRRFRLRSGRRDERAPSTSPELAPSCSATLTVISDESPNSFERGRPRIPRDGPTGADLEQDTPCLCTVGYFPIRVTIFE